MVEASSQSLLRATQQGLAQLLFRNWEWVQLSGLWGLMVGKEEHMRGLLLGKDKMVCLEPAQLVCLNDSKYGVKPEAGTVGIS